MACVISLVMSLIAITTSVMTLMLVGRALSQPLPPAPTDEEEA